MILFRSLLPDAWPIERSAAYYYLKKLAQPPTEGSLPGSN
jgi:hypothetical protein